MNILSMLARLEDALGCADLAKQMVLLPPLQPAQSPSLQEEINLVVGYNGSPGSQTALDLTLWIAHQTRLATRKQVTVQVVYVVNLETECRRGSPFAHEIAPVNISGISGKKSVSHREVEVSTRTNRQRSSSAIAELPELNGRSEAPQSCQSEQFEQADRILWQARHLADEWRGSLKTHLRFGQVAQEIRDVVKAESAAVLLLGCDSPENRVVQQLGANFPCPVLGIPSAL